MRIKRRWFWLTLAVMLAAVAGAVVGLRHFSEPRYNGKRVIEWALELNGPQDTAPATHFFLRADPEAVSVLAGALAQKESFGKPLVLRIGARMPEDMRARFYRYFDPFGQDRRRRAAVQALALMGTNAIGALPELSDAIHDPDIPVAFGAAQALGKIGKPALPALIAAVKEGTSTAQKMAMQAFSSIGWDAAEAIPVLVKALEDLPAVRADASKALGEIGRPAVGPLCGALRHTNAAVRSLAAQALSRIGPLAREAAPELTKALTDPSADVRTAAASALAALQIPDR